MRTVLQQWHVNMAIRPDQIDDTHTIELANPPHWYTDHHSLCTGLARDKQQLTLVLLPYSR